MNEGRALWGRLALSSGLAASSLVLLAPPRPEPVDAATAAALALVAGGTLFVLVHGARVRLARARLPPGVQLARAGVFVLLAASEETVWRRAILGEGLAVSRPFAFLVSSLGFALVHRAGRAKQFVTGATFGGVYLASGSLLAAIAAHVLYNLLVAASVDAARARAAPVT